MRCIIKTASLQTILQEIYTQQGDNAVLISLLRFLADELWSQYQTGTYCMSLRNENILVAYEPPATWQSLTIRNTEHLTTPLTLQQLAQSLSGIDLPDDYWRIFKHMYFRDQIVPEQFNTLADQLRQQRRQREGVPGIAEQNIWLWDEKSAQPMITLHSAAKNKLRSKTDLLRMGWHTLLNLPKLYFTYKKLLRTAFRRRVNLQHRIGIALHPAYWPQERVLLQELGNIPVIIRIYCHEHKTVWQDTIQLITELQQKNILVALALVQDRQAVLDPKRWQELLSVIIPPLHDKIQWLEVGHAINRVKWGIWRTAEYAQLVAMVAALRQQYPTLRLVGPAVIDFEWYRLLPALKTLPKQQRWYALSQHLYVDRRGAPENYQGKFSTLEKCALAKAIAEITSNCDDRMIISEFNWPLKNTGIYSPIGSPYTAPEWFRDQPGVTETEYANYLIRYLAITLASGFAEQVYLWRLSAHGYGLVDDKDNFQPRPAFKALKIFLQLLGQAEFKQRYPSSSPTYLLSFKASQGEILLAWTTKKNCTVELPWSVQIAKDLYGADLPITGTNVTLSTQPIYFIREKI